MFKWLSVNALSIAKLKIDILFSRGLVARALTFKLDCAKLFNQIFTALDIFSNSGL